MKRKKHIGGLFDAFLKEERIYEEEQVTAIKCVLAWQLEQVMKEQKITKIQMARSMKTSRAQLDRLLDPVNESVTLGTLARAAAVVGRKLCFEFVQTLFKGCPDVVSIHSQYPPIYLLKLQS